jgi:hypothetical protein
MDTMSAAEENMVMTNLIKAVAELKDEVVTLKGAIAALKGRDCCEGSNHKYFIGARDCSARGSDYFKGSEPSFD